MKEVSIQVNLNDNPAFFRSNFSSNDFHTNEFIDAYIMDKSKDKDNPLGIIVYSSLNIDNLKREKKTYFVEINNNCKATFNEYKSDILYECIYHDIIKPGVFECFDKVEIFSKKPFINESLETRLSHIDKLVTMSVINFGSTIWYPIIELYKPFYYYVMQLNDYFTLIRYIYNNNIFVIVSMELHDIILAKHVSNSTFEVENCEEFINEFNYFTDSNLSLQYTYIMERSGNK